MAEHAGRTGIRKEPVDTVTIDGWNMLHRTDGCPKGSQESMRIADWLKKRAVGDDSPFLSTLFCGIPGAVRTYSPSVPAAFGCAAALSREAWMASNSTREVYLLSAVYVTDSSDWLS